MTARRGTLPAVRPIQGATGEWLLKLQCEDGKTLLRCVEVIMNLQPRTRMEVRSKPEEPECAVEILNRQKAKEILGKLEALSRRSKTIIRYALGNVTASNLDTGELPERGPLNRAP